MKRITLTTLAALAFVIGATSSASAGMLLPAVQSAREAARRSSIQQPMTMEFVENNYPEPGSAEFELLSDKEQEGVLTMLLLPAIQKLNNEEGKAGCQTRR